MALDKMPQFQAEEDGCVYIYDPDHEKWRKACEVAELPPSVKRQVREIRETARALEGA